MKITRPRLAILIIAVFGSTTVFTQKSSAPVAKMAAAREAAPAPAPAAAPLATAVDADTRTVKLLVGRSAVVDAGGTISRVSLTSADIADALVTGPGQLLVHGKVPGTISMFVWDRGGALHRYEVTVQRDLTKLSDQLKQIFPAETIQVENNGKNIILSGAVSNKDIIEKANSLASGFVDKKDEVISLLQIRDGAPSNQVLLRVRFAEVSRSAITEFGAALAANGAKDGRWFGRSTTGQFPAPEWDKDGKFVFSDFLNLFLFDRKSDLAAVVKALQNRGLFQSLAEPNLVAESGKEASFLAGGEFPIPIAQPGSGGISIVVQFKEFGVRLNFTPTVIGDRVHLKVRPEVSTLDFTNAIVLQGFRIPALSTRRTETELELQNGQTFAIAGLINNTMNQSLQKIPGIGDIPILGELFKSRASQKDQTELVVMITPEILANNSTGVTPNLPKLAEPYLPPMPQKKQIEPPPPAFKGPSAGAGNATPAAPVAQAVPTQAVTAKTAAETMTALNPNTRKVVNGDAPAATNVKAAGKPSPKDEKALQQAKAENAKRAAAQAEVDRRAQQAEAERQAKLQQEQARRDAEEAKRVAAENKKAAERQAEIDRKQAEIRKKHDKAIAEAEARLKAAQEEYKAEAAKVQQQH